MEFLCQRFWAPWSLGIMSYSPLKYALNVYWHWGHTNRYSKYINNLKNLF